MPPQNLQMENDFIIAKHCKFVLTNGTGFDALAALWFKNQFIIIT